MLKLGRNYGYDSFCLVRETKALWLLRIVGDRIDPSTQALSDEIDHVTQDSE